MQRWPGVYSPEFQSPMFFWDGMQRASKPAPTRLRGVLVQVDFAESNGHGDFTWRVSVSFAWRGE